MAHTRQARRKGGAPVLMTGVLLLLLVGIGVGVVFFAVRWLRGSLTTPGSITPSMGGNTEPSENVSYGFGQIIPKWAGKERVTVLVLGIDERSQEAGPWRTDTIMVLTLDPEKGHAGVLSVPRDLWVPIPGHNDGRINTAHFLGDLYDHPGGGPALAMETVEYNLGIPIDYYVRVNFQAFVTLVDQIGGIDVYVEETIDDQEYPDHNYGYDPLHIDAGWQHLDGEMALKYARTRHGSSDFDRARRQQQVMLAILKQVTSYELLPELARSAPQLFQTLQSSIATNMALDQVLALANRASKVEEDDIRFGVIDQTCTQPYITATGAQVLIPLRDQMREVRDYVFEDRPVDAVADESAITDGPPASEPSEPAATPTPEVASVAILNGTRRPGLAGSTADYLREQGLDVARVANADRQDYTKTQVVLNRNRPMALSTLLEVLDISSASVVNGSDPDAAQDIVVVLGQDFTGPPQF